jgi:hypothetical protein
MTKTFKRIATEPLPADRQLHVFSTFLGMPPDSDTKPVCGAELTSDYSGRNQPKCPACLRILREHNRKKGVKK